MLRTTHPNPQPRSALLSFLVILLFVTWIFPVRVVTVMGPSMLPTYHEGQSVVVDTEDYHLRRGDVAVFREPEDGFIIKRVIALGGDVVGEIKNTKEAGWAYEDPNASATITAYNKIAFTQHKEPIERRRVKVPVGEVYIAGDNRLNTIFGLRKLRHLYGKVLE